MLRIPAETSRIISYKPSEFVILSPLLFIGMYQPNVYKNAVDTILINDNVCAIVFGCLLLNSYATTKPICLKIETEIGCFLVKRMGSFLSRKYPWFPRDLTCASYLINISLYLFRKKYST